MLPVVLPQSAIELLAHQSSGGALVTVDLLADSVTAPDGTVFRFTLDPMRREMLLAGTDELGLTLLRATEIAAWQNADALRRPWVIPKIRSEVL
jgi:3-isopropylmalate/(R)-2-methylmalate dehydratase small subunit